MPNCFSEEIAGHRLNHSATGTESLGLFNEVNYFVVNIMGMFNGERKLCEIWYNCCVSIVVKGINTKFTEHTRSCFRQHRNLQKGMDNST